MGVNTELRFRGESEVQAIVIGLLSGLQVSCVHVRMMSGIGSPSYVY